MVRLLHRNEEPMDYEGGRPLYANRRSRKALKEFKAYQRGEKDLKPYEPVKSRNTRPESGHLYEIETTSRFRRDLKRMRKRGADVGLLDRAIRILADGGQLPPSFQDHPLQGEWTGARECHIRPDWLFVYAIDGERLKLLALRTGTHSDLFGERGTSAYIGGHDSNVVALIVPVYWVLLAPSRHSLLISVGTSMLSS